MLCKNSKKNEREREREKGREKKRILYKMGDGNYIV